MNLLSNQIYLQGNVPSSKNGKQIVKMGGRIGLIDNQTVKAYVDHLKPQLLEHRGRWLDLVSDKTRPYMVMFSFIRDSRRKFDFMNPAQTLADCLCGIKYPKNERASLRWIDDDDNTWLIPVFDPLVVVDKERAGVILTIL